MSMLGFVPTRSSPYLCRTAGARCHIHGESSGACVTAYLAPYRKTPCRSRVPGSRGGVFIEGRRGQKPVKR